ncbi:MAG: hypothetical protein WAR57_04330 [Candidatus Phosphoribacter sp.]
MITSEDIKKFAPKARPEYVAALLGGMDHLRAAGILDNPYRLCHFMAQVGHETGGLTIIRESLHYTSAASIRRTWPARFKDKTDAELAPLVKNGVALGDAVYTGRMGNDQPGDGYTYRGGGFLQTTGKGAVAEYAKKLGLDPSPSMLDDVAVTLRFACMEWQDAGCCACADENDLTKVSKAINTGSATSNVRPVGLDDRKARFAKAWAIWGDKGKADQPAKPPMTVKDALVKVGTPVAIATEGVRQVGIPGPASQINDTISNVTAWKSMFGTVKADPLLLAAVAAFALIWIIPIGLKKLKG